MHLVFPSLGDRIGAVNEFKAEWAEQIKKFGWDGPTTYYGKVNIDVGADAAHILNSGVIVWQPRKHAALVEAFIAKYGPESATHPRGPHYEQGVFGGWALTGGHWAGPPGLPGTWNALWIGQRIFGGGGPVGDYVARNHFIHLAAGDVWNVGEEFARHCAALRPPSASASPAPPVPAPAPGKP